MLKAVPPRNTQPIHSIRRDRNRCQEGRALTLFNHSKLVYQRFHLVTQRAKVFANASHEWVDANLGLEAHHEVSILLSDGTGCAWRNAFNGLRRRRPDPRMLDRRWCISLRTPPARSPPSPSARAAGGLPIAAWLKVYKGAKGVKSNGGLRCAFT